MSFDDLVRDDCASLMDIFGIPATLSDGVHTTKPIKVVFDSTSIDSIGVLTDKPQVSLLTTDLENIDLKNTVLTINDTGYRILKPLTDGYGLSLATLARY